MGKKVSEKFVIWGCSDPLRVVEDSVIMAKAKANGEKERGKPIQIKVPLS